MRINYYNKYVNAGPVKNIYASHAQVIIHITFQTVLVASGQANITRKPIYLEHINMNLIMKRYTFINMPVLYMVFINISGCIYFDCIFFVYIFAIICVFISRHCYVFHANTKKIHPNNFGLIISKAWKIDTLVWYINNFDWIITWYCILSNRSVDVASLTRSEFI